MQKIISKLKADRFLCISLLLLFPFFKLSGQIILHHQAGLIKPKAFFIAGINDERADKSRLGQLLVRDLEGRAMLRTTDLEGGAAAAIGEFIRHSLPQDHSLKPVVIGIKELCVQESQQTGGNVKGMIKIRLSFGLQKDYGTEHLVDYQGGLQYTRSGAGTAAIEEYLRGILKGSFDYLDKWMKDNSAVNRKLAETVKISFRDYMENPEGDTIYYSFMRPLKWSDFQSRSQPSGIFEAQVIPGIGYTQQAQVDKGTIEVEIVMKTFLPKSACRANYSGRDEYTLNHEQRHFDIAKIIAEQFKDKIKSRQLTPDNFEAIINMQYLDSYRDMDAMQKAYDTETRHGTDRAAQSAWNSKIDKFLSAM
ncbi:DUF922 domain-containing protein [Pedobacter westerhofensis]|nr:hypothetical protein [Pedobacter westerhofensis]